MGVILSMSCLRWLENGLAVFKFDASVEPALSEVMLTQAPAWHSVCARRRFPSPRSGRAPPPAAA
jgi:hypothetical protein